MSSRKSELLGGVLRYLFRHGVANLSLRPLAAELGTSARILMFHFGSKDRLLQDVMQELTSRLNTSLALLVQRQEGSRRVAPLRLFWDWATHEDNLPCLRLLYEAQVIAMQNPEVFGPCLKGVAVEWHEMALRSMSDSLKSSSLATICVAVFDGLMLELMATGDHRKLTLALDEFIRMVTRHGARMGGRPKRSSRLNAVVSKRK